MTRFMNKDKYLDRKFTVDNGKSSKYQKNWAKVFGGKKNNNKESDPNKSHISDGVSMYLEANGRTLEVADYVWDRCLVRAVEQWAPCEADLVVIMDDMVFSKRVFLADGVHAGSTTVKMRPMSEFKRAWYKLKMGAR